MNIHEAMQFIHSTSWKGSQLGLNRIEELMRLLRNPQDELRFVHIAGTNGKGSTAAMLAAILTEAGYITGLYTSPYLYRFNERMKVNGVDITNEDLIRLTEKMKPCVEQMQEKPTEFELITAMAFLYYREQGCDVVVLEVGLGGRLDSTNIIKAPVVSVITNIALDHTEVLGDTLEKIANEKAGIIKSGTPVVLYGQSTELEEVIRRQCVKTGSPLTISCEQHLLTNKSDLFGQNFDYRARKNLNIPLAGTYQLNNAVVVLDVVDVLNVRNFQISEQAVRDGLKKTVWPGRFELLRDEPLFLVDGAHNSNGVKALAASLRTYLPGQKLTFLTGVMADKDYTDMIAETVSLADCYITVTPDNPRALSSAKLKYQIETVFKGDVTDAGTVENGIALAQKSTGPICAFGSLYMVGKIRKAFGYG